MFLGGGRDAEDSISTSLELRALPSVADLLDDEGFEDLRNMTLRLEERMEATINCRDRGLSCSWDGCCCWGDHYYCSSILVESAIVYIVV